MKETTYWEVFVINDVEGRSTKSIAKFSNPEAAEQFIQSEEGKDMYGKPGMISELTHLLFDHAHEVVSTHWDSLRRSGMSKLTREEQIALGLNKLDTETKRKP